MLEAKHFKVPCHWHLPAHSEQPKPKQYADICAAIDASDACLFSLEGMVKDGVERTTAATYIQIGYALGARKPIVVYDPCKTTRETKHKWPPAFTNLMGYIFEAEAFQSFVLWTDDRDAAFAALRTLKFPHTAEDLAPQPGVGQITGSWFQLDQCKTLIEWFKKEHDVDVACDWTNKEEHLDKPKPVQLDRITRALWTCQAFYLSLDGMEIDGKERETAASYIQYGMALGAKLPIVVYDPAKTTRPSPKECRKGCPPAFNNIMGESLVGAAPNVVWTDDKDASVTAFTEFLKVA